MKGKILVLVVSIFALTVFCLSGCGNSAKVSIQDYQWEVTTIQDNDNGNVIACSDDNTETFPDAAEIDLSCTIDGKGLTLTNRNDNLTYNGTYVKKSSESDSIIYSILIDKDAGTAVCA